MIPGNSVQDADPACRSESDDASRSGATAGYDAADYGNADHPARPPRTHRAKGSHRPLQDIQEIIDELAAVTQRLRHPGDRVRDPSR
jgi:hypothetical protein